MEKRKFRMVSISALCNDDASPVITIPVIEKSGDVAHISYEAHPIGCSLAGYQPVRLKSCVDGYIDINVPDGVLNVHLGKEDIQLQFTWEKDYDPDWGEYETEMLNITYLF